MQPGGNALRAKFSLQWRRQGGKLARVVWRGRQGNARVIQAAPLEEEPLDNHLMKERRPAGKGGERWREALWQDWPVTRQQS